MATEAVCRELRPRLKPGLGGSAGARPHGRGGCVLPGTERGKTTVRADSMHGVSAV